jgi:hypothetical protein
MFLWGVLIYGKSIEWTIWDYPSVLDLLQCSTIQHLHPELSPANKRESIALYSSVRAFPARVEQNQEE